MALSDGKYILLTTFRRDGTGVATPVWVVPLDSGAFGMWTSSGSGKAKRLGNTDRVLVQPCDARGRVKDGTAPLEGTARLVTGPEHAVIVERINAKYGFMTTITRLLNTVGGFVKGKRIPYGDRGVVITLADSA
jgi:PPOX class probable F420-dependent enzyme